MERDFGADLRAQRRHDLQRRDDYRDRRKIVEFSRPYFEFEPAIVVPRISALRSVQDLAGGIIGVRRATSAEEVVRKRRLAKSTGTFHLDVNAYCALRTDELDAVVDDDPIAEAFQKQFPGLKVTGTIEDTKMQYGIVFAKGDGVLRMAVDQALSKLEIACTYADLYQQWFGESGPRLPAVSSE